jgi:CubicO group peptidase (beta-lactamase class C family)
MIEGTFSEGFHKVAELFEQQLGKTDGGASVAVFHRGELVVDLWGGMADEGKPWQRDTLAMCYSTTKGVVATAAHVLADRGLLDYDEPVATYWPEFAQNGKEGITVRHVLSHSAGMHRIGTVIDHGHRILDWEHMTEALEQAAPAYPPGTSVGYHALTFGWLVGEIVRRISGMSLNQFVQENIAGPLGLHGLFIGCPPEERHRAAPLKALSWPMPLRSVGKVALRPRVSGALSRSRVNINPRRIQNTLSPRGIEDVLLQPEMMDAEVPAMNGYFDAVSLATMYAMLANGGEFGGVRILKPETVARATEVQNDQRDRVVIVNMQWRLGYHRVPHLYKQLPFIYGHMGFGGSGAWADPQNNLALAMVCNRGGGTPIGDRRIMSLTSATADAVRQPPRAASFVTHPRHVAN